MFPEPTVKNAIAYRLREPLLRPFCDSHTVLAQHKVPLRIRRDMRTRYVAASLGKPKTKNEERLCAFKNCYQGGEIWLIGNGPSLNELDLSFLKDQVTIGTNGIFLASEDFGFNVTHYVVEDFLVAEDRSSAIQDLRESQVWVGNYLNYCLSPLPEAIWLNVSPFLPRLRKSPKFSFDASRILYSGGTVTYLCLQLAYFFGAQRVNLIGFDHNYEEPDSGARFGSILTSHQPDRNHFRNDYFGPGFRWHRPRLERMERAYRVAREVYEGSGRCIVNRGVGGSLEVFAREPLL